MNIGINASFVRKPHTGIGQVTINFLRELILQARAGELDKKIQYILYLEEPLSQDITLPENFTARVMLPLWKRDDLIRKIWWERYTLPQAVRKDRCDALLSLYQCPTVVLPGVKHIMLVHDLIPRIFPQYLNNNRKRLYQQLTEEAIKKADYILTVSEKTRQDVVARLKVDPMRVETNGIDVDPLFKRPVSFEKSRETLDRYGIEAGYIYSGGGLETRKNADGTMRAYKLLSEQYLREGRSERLPQLVISGKLMPQLAPLITDVEKLARELGIEANVKILGYVPQEHLPALYANASMFVFPSRYEGFGLPVLEAMNIGTPVVTAKTSSLPEVCGEAVLYADPESDEDIAEKMRKLLEDRALHEQCIIRGRDRAKLFSWKKFTERALALMKIPNAL